MEKNIFLLDRSGSVNQHHQCTHWGTEAWIRTHLLGYIAMLGLYILSRFWMHTFVRKSQWTPVVGLILNSCWASVADDVPTLLQHWFNILHLLGGWSRIICYKITSQNNIFNVIRNAIIICFRCFCFKRITAMTFCGIQVFQRVHDDCAPCDTKSRKKFTYFTEDFYAWRKSDKPICWWW